MAVEVLKGDVLNETPSGEDLQSFSEVSWLWLLQVSSSPSQRDTHFFGKILDPRLKDNMKIKQIETVGKYFPQLGRLLLHFNVI